MYAIGHIRPHSLCAGPSLSLTRQSPHLSLDCPRVPCLRGPLTSWPSFAAYACLPLASVPVWSDFGARSAFESTYTIHWLSRHCREHTDLTRVTEIRLKPLQLSCHWNSYYNETVSDVLLVDIVDVHIGRSCRFDEESSSPTSTQGFRLSSESADQTRHWHCVRAVKQTFHRRSRRRHLHHRRRRWICRTAVAQCSAAGICAAICNIALFPSFVRCGRPVSYP